VEEEAYHTLEPIPLLHTATAAAAAAAPVGTAQQVVVVVVPGLRHLWVTATTQTIFGTRVILAVIIHLIIVIKYLFPTDQTLVEGA
jgi:hypothetical protein